MTRGAALLAGLLLAVVVAVPVTADPAAGDPEAGRETFAANCAACHGPDAQGRSGVPALVGVVDRLDPEQVATTIREGRGGMPAFGGRLDDG